MKWYFAIEETGTHHEPGVLALAAVRSCREHTDLEPVCLFDGSNPVFLAELAKLGVRVIQCEVPFANRIDQNHRTVGYPLTARGAFLRTVIPSVEKDDDYVLYTDIDILFLKQPTIDVEAVRDFPIGVVEAETLGDRGAFNSGVMLMNLPRMRDRHDEFMAFCAENMLSFLPGFDQIALNRFYRDNVAWLSPHLNWRPYWGIDPSAEILHFHGIKLTGLMQFATFDLTNDIGYAPQLRELIYRDLPAMLSFAKLFRRYVDDPTVLAKLDVIEQALNRPVEEQVVLLYRRAYDLTESLRRSSEVIESVFYSRFGEAPAREDAGRLIRLQLPEETSRVMVYASNARGPFEIADLQVDGKPVRLDEARLLSGGPTTLGRGERWVRFNYRKGQPQVDIQLPAGGKELLFRLVRLGADPVTVYFGTPEYSEPRKVVIT